jgi:hypothetical protein
MTQNKTYILLKKETSLSLIAPPQTATAFEGFLLKIEVSKSHKISPKVFVMQRDVDSNYIAEGVTDNFFSVASVGEIEWIPEDSPNSNSTNFYRTDKIELVFESREDLDQAWKKIKFDVVALAKANDVTYEIAEETFVPFPEDSLPMYYGTSHADLVTSELVSSLSENPNYGTEFEFPFVMEVNSHIYVAVHKTLGQELKIRTGTILREMEVSLIELPAKYSSGVEEYYLYKTLQKVVAPLSGRVYISRL